MSAGDRGSCLRRAGACLLQAPGPISGSGCLEGGALPAQGAGSLLPELDGGLNESGVLEEPDEDLVDKLVLGDGLDHEHALLSE